MFPNVLKHDQTPVKLLLPGDRPIDFVHNVFYLERFSTYLALNIRIVQHTCCCWVFFRLANLFKSLNYL